MPLKQFLSGLTLRRYAAVLGILSCMLFLNFKAIANFTIPSGTGSWSCWLLATSTHYPSGPTGEIAPSGGSASNPWGPYIYDDGYSNFDPGVIHANGDWNCDRQYLFTEYTNEPVTFYFSYGNEYPTSPTWPVTQHIVKIYLNGATMPMFTSPPINDYTGTDPTPFPLPATVTNTPGAYSIEYWRYGGPTMLYPDITGQIVLIPQIQKLWIVAPPICPNFTGNYNFQVHAYPDLPNLIVSSSGILFSPLPSCEPVPANYIRINFDASTFSSVCNSLLSQDIYQSWNFSNPSQSDCSLIPGSSWPSSGTPPDINDYYITNGTYSDDLASYLTGGSNYGKVPIINVVFTDGITTMSATVPIIIQYPAVPKASYLGNAAGVPYGPPNATGIPWPSYDIYDYTVSGTETWTPTNNPMSNMNGNYATNTIRIQDNITIPTGATLELEDGMTIEMGPQATVTVGPASTSAGQGGLLSLGSSTITAYRGCNGTDQSTWSGITLAANNPLLPQGTNWYVTPEPRLWLDGSTVSYADIGVQTGSSNTCGGGEIMTPLGASTFYNNKQDVAIYPYRNMSGPRGTEMNSWLNFEHTIFKNDNNAPWFTSPGFITAAGIEGLYMYSCEFTNTTSATIPYAISATEASMIIDGGAFNNFQVAVNASYTTATHSLLVGSSLPIIAPWIALKPE